MTRRGETSNPQGNQEESPRVQRGSRKRRSKKNSNPLPETAPTNPVLTDILNTGSLCEQFVHLVADVQLTIVSEISAGQLLPNSGKDLQSTGILSLTSFGAALLNVEDTPLQNRGTSGTGDTVGLQAMLKVETFNQRLAALCGKSSAVGRLLRSQAPIDQGVVDKLGR